MDRPIDRASLDAAWRALSLDDKEGWRTIPIGSAGPVRILAGRRFPSKDEAVLFGIPGYRRPTSDQLPSGRGFEVVRVTLEKELGELQWIGITHGTGASIDLFAMMISDLSNHVAEAHSRGIDELGSALLARVRGWQDFMQRSNGVLGKEAEVGLAGEIIIVREIIAAGVDPEVVVDSWQGPMNGLHDLVFTGGSMEVKSSAATAGFLAEISSLDQLDDSTAAPLFLAAIRLASPGAGSTLPELVAALRSDVSGRRRAATELEMRLLHAGYIDRFADRYIRRFEHAGTRVFKVDSAFPRLVHGLVPPAVRRARYDIDVDMVNQAPMTLGEALSQIGVQ